LFRGSVKAAAGVRGGREVGPGKPRELRWYMQVREMASMIGNRTLDDGRLAFLGPTKRSVNSDHQEFAMQLSPLRIANYQ